MPTEDVVFMLDGLGIYTGVDLDRLVDVGRFISDALGRQSESRAAVAIESKRIDLSSDPAMAAEVEREERERQQKAAGRPELRPPQRKQQCV